MKLGITGPITTAAFLEYLDPAYRNLPGLPPGLGGTPVVALALGLLARGHKIVIFSLDESVSDELVLNGPALRICFGPFRRQHRARDFFAAERAYLARAILREQPSVVHAHWTYEFALGSLDSGVTTVVTVHDAPLRTLMLDPTPYRLIRVLMAFQVARRARFLTAVSRSVADHFRAILRFRRPIAIIPNGLPDQIFSPRESHRLRAHGRVTFVSVLTGWGKLKNASTLLKAFGEVHATLPQTRLILFGAGHGPGEGAERWACDRGLQAGVIFAGQVDYSEVIALISREADVMVHPSLEESFGMTIAEAMAMAVPVIAGGHSGVVSTLEDGKAGVLTDVSDHRKLAREMLLLAGSESIRSRVGRAAFESANRRFRLDTVLVSYLKVLNSANGGTA